MIILLAVFIISGLVFIGYSSLKQTKPEETTSTYLPRLSVKESEYIKVKRQECFERYKDKLLWTNPQRKVDLCNPTVLVENS